MTVDTDVGVTHTVTGSNIPLTLFASAKKLIAMQELLIEKPSVSTFPKLGVADWAGLLSNTKVSTSTLGQVKKLKAYSCNLEAAARDSFGRDQFQNIAQMARVIGVPKALAHFASHNSKLLSKVRHGLHLLCVCVCVRICVSKPDILCFISAL
jgi:hypothetical protein